MILNRHNQKHYKMNFRLFKTIIMKNIEKLTRKWNLFDALIRFDISNIGYQHVQTWPNENSSTESRFASSAH